MWLYWDDDLLLRGAILMSIFMIDDDGVILWDERAIKEEKDNLFALFL